LLRIAAHVREGKNRNVRPIWSRRADNVFGAGRLRSHIAYEAQTFARNGTDQFLVLPSIPDRLARGVDAANDGPIGNNPAAPDRRNEVFLADDTITVLQEVNEQIEHLRLDLDAFDAAQQRALIGVERVT